MNMEHCNQSKSFQKGEWGRRENNGEDELNQGTIYVCMKYHNGTPSVTIIY
jgi:hypothetical protein